MINVSPSLSYNKSLDTITQTLPWTTYIQTLYFDFCDDSTGENCAPSSDAPSVSDISITGTLAEGEEVSGSYIFSDDQGDSDNSSYRWFLADDEGTNRFEINDAINQTYVVEYGDGDYYLQFCVTPNDGQESGYEVCSDYYSIVANNHPTADDVTITGDTEVASTVSASYTYEDADDDVESNSIFQWYTCENNSTDNCTTISNAILNTYELMSSEGGTFVKFCVTPSDGKDNGEEVCSDLVFITNEQDSEIFAGFGKALNLDGDNGYVQVELSGILETSETSFSFETWFKADTLSTDQVLWSQQDGDGTGGAWLWLDSSCCNYR
jgi:hypothetical protein